MKRFISITVSMIILSIIYSKIDLQALADIFLNSHRFWMPVSLAMVIPITLFTAWRLQQLMPKSTYLGFWEANRLILAASVLNMVLPSKMGDIAKAYFMRERGHLSGSLSLSLVVFEKSCDLLSLLLWCVFGLFLYPQKDVIFLTMTLGVITGLIIGILILSSRNFADFLFFILEKITPKTIGKKIAKLQESWTAMHEHFWSDKRQLLKISATSIFIWFLHLLQIWFFILALNAWVPFITNLALSPLAILAGLMPLTFAGVGTRDAALVIFYEPYFNATVAAGLGLLCTARYFLPAVGGLPFLSQYLTTVRNLKQSDI
ncbi:lysylphosphatidylglycerol synthase transmembrane domain-containing protein [Limnospira platensis]|uniref:lysylphosphatidylglycerol synthase transmembrane domain-containing protein n=1 Tax=Limnospira platensis TaxID=118562 RepID=UPI0021AAA039|nr:hypothetical protein APLC1_5754 [Arthrospira platensis C1]